MCTSCRLAASYTRRVWVVTQQMRGVNMRTESHLSVRKPKCVFLPQCSISSECNDNRSVPHSSSTTSWFLSESDFWMLIVKMSKNVVHHVFILFVILYWFILHACLLLLLMKICLWSFFSCPVGWKSPSFQSPSIWQKPFFSPLCLDSDGREVGAG